MALHGFELTLQLRLARFLDGSARFPLAMLHRAPGEYRSLTLATFAWTIAFLRSFLSLPALLMLPVWGLVSLFFLLSADSPVRLLLPVLPLLFLADTLFGGIFRPKLKIVRQLPERVRCGTTFEAAFFLTNRRRLPAWCLEADPFRYAPGITVSDYGGWLNVPGRGNGNIRKLLRAEKRGSYLIASPRIRSGFPFHLVQWGCTEEQPMTRLVVYPAFTSLNSLDLPLSRRFRQTAGTASGRTGETEQWKGTREFRSGDDIRRIDWHGSVRTGELVIKEFDAQQMKMVALIIDTQLPSPNFFALQLTAARERRAFESAISLATAVTEFLARGEATVELFAAGPKIHRIRAGSNGSSFDRVCDLLSTIRASTEPLNAIAPEFFREFSAVGAAVVILAGCDRERQNFVETLSARGVAVKPVVVSNDRKSPLPPGWLRFSPEEIDSGKVREL